MPTPAVTVRPARGARRVAVLAPTPDRPEHVTVTFDRIWNVYLDGTQARMLFVGLDTDGHLHGVQGAKVLIVGDGKPAAVAAILYRLADPGNLW